MDGPIARTLWVLLGALALCLALTPAIRRLDAVRHPLGGALRAMRNLLVPTVALLLFFVYALGWDASKMDPGPPERLLPTSVTVRLIETLLWIEVIHVTLSSISATLFARASGPTWRAKVPKLFLDLARLSLVLVGIAFVLSAVWGKDLGGLLTALGVGSIVLGLALQDTLGNVMAGIALLFEQPFGVGDWIKVQGKTGKVIEMNWRAVRLRTRARDMLVVPNSMLGKEIIENLSKPTLEHAEYFEVGFSYDDPPNKVKRVLLKAALSTRGIVANPAPHVRTIAYADSSVTYQIRFFIEEYDRQPEIVDEFVTQIWYAGRRNGLTIPFPIRTVFKTEVPPTPLVNASAGAKAALQSVPVFVPLGPEELEAIARDSVIQGFARGESVVQQGDPGDALYIVLEGTAVVTIRDEQGNDREVARLSRGEFFGEMALLTGEPRTATVTAGDDLQVIVVYKEALQGLLSRRPGLAQEMAEIVESRRQGLRAVKEIRMLTPQRRDEVLEGATLLVARIRRFLGI